MASITTLLETMRMLRDKDKGCPWDIEQTLESLSPCVVEEAYEVADAIARKDYNNLKEELGDVLLQVVFHAEIANELKLFNFDEIVDTLNKKLIRRHPHVFEDAPKPLSAQEQTQAWDAIKAQEKNSQDTLNTFDDIPSSLPPILKAKKIQNKASKKGFDWKESFDVIEKVEEELKELKLEIQQNNNENIQDELGDLLFSIINLSRHLEIDASEAINQANHKFVKRFRLMEEEISKDNQEIDNLTSDELEEFWVKIKSHE
ncbi:nucleoside triphosphate pyrophosphohydrolase [Gammaproteobacteria bacterium]|nr:nucleoside triphosphate pyrophosphohydrolase [Gammaproteobacteria bacterium]MDA8798924.1 nucleoside triphosphate pyrophosphohydrolase [Gammaproteobacteria bacterium]MDC0919381.1 nucleoside triphosphate pyrophosphohydrolase [Gammaproteobacteria bacterium]